MDAAGDFDDAVLGAGLDDPIEARDALAKLRAPDPEDRVGGALVEAVRVRALVGDPWADDGEPDSDGRCPAFGAAAWQRASGRAAPDDAAAQHHG